MENVDLVYLWVDGNDPDWKIKKQKAQVERGIEPDPQVVNKGRFVDNEELRYSLRSVEMYAPWINKIYIVTDDQTPSWLNTENPKIKLVSHKDILPAECLPTFNSHALELALTNIEGLSERFLYANDDTFFAQPVTPEFFYTSDGFPIARFSRRRKFSSSTLYSTVLNKAQALIKQKYGRCCTHNPHHNIDAYLKSDVKRCIGEFADLAERTQREPFRTPNDLQRVVFLLWALVNGRAKKKIVRHYGSVQSPREFFRCLINGKYRVDSRSFGLHVANVEKKIEKYNPTLMCLNDTEMATDECRGQMKDYLERRFPYKSSFEK